MHTVYRSAARPWGLFGDVGNHRVVVEAAIPGPYIRVCVEWRRRDLYPERCGVLARALKDGREVQVKALDITRQRGEYVLEVPEAGQYAIYYMPCKRVGDNWWSPVMEYGKEAFPSCSEAWAAGIPEQMPEGAVLAIESRTEFDSFYPMEVPATAEETAALLETAGDVPFVIFPEDRKYPVRMLYELPLRWVERGLREAFHGEAQPDEYYVFQLAVYARKELPDITLTYLDFAGDIMPEGGAVTCYNREGTDWMGRPFANRIRCAGGRVQPLWFGLQMPPDRVGDMHFAVSITAEGYTCTVPVHISVRGEPVASHGDGELWRLSRLRWLNSTAGLDEEAAKPFTPVRREGKDVFCLGRRVTLAEDGLPAGISSFFDQSIRIGEEELPIIRKPIEFAVYGREGRLEFAEFVSSATNGSGACMWETCSRGPGLSMKNESRLEYDGHLEVFLTIFAEEDTELLDVSLNISFTPECSRYMMGMGRAGGERPDSWEYQWDINRTNNYVWIGGVNGGLHLKLKHTEEVWEIYNYQKEGLPDSWSNSGKGGCSIQFGEDGGELKAYSGLRMLKAGECLTFRFSLQITPIKPLDSDAHWRERYDHPGDRGIDLAAAKAGGATVVNLHQGQKENPYINYPFCRDGLLKEEIRKAHKMDMKYKLYYTVRELTTHAQEFFAVRSLGNEILMDGPSFRVAEHFMEGFFQKEEASHSTGGPWICEHLPEGCIPAWQTLLPDGDYDSSVATVGLSRWHNYYLEGLSWLVREMGADGIYLDGVGYDRQIMKRVRKVLDGSKEGCLIDFHSGNNFHLEYGLNNVLGQYMELLPSVDSLWIGEGFDYEGTLPDYWLVEVSGIPFGLMGDMLHRGGNKWRGMVFGMTPRCNWPEGGSPLPIWQLWDSFGMKGCIVRGWWDEKCPVRATHPGCRATAFVQEDRILISLASWAEETAETKLELQLPEGWFAEKVSAFIPYIEEFQEGGNFRLGDRLEVPAAKGKILILTKER